MNDRWIVSTGEQRFQQAEALARAGQTDEALRLFEQLCAECPTSWIDRAARQRIEQLQSAKP